MTESDQWRINDLDLDAYLARLGLPAEAPTRDYLDSLHEAHLHAFTFDNLDVLLNQHPGVALKSVQEKFVGRGRGGYCFEHSVLFGAALQRLGYNVVRRLGRVGDPTQTARTHLVIEVSLDGQRLLADPGFGFSIRRPIPLVDEAQDTYRGATHRVRRSAEAGQIHWELQRLRESGWERMHTTDELTVYPADVDSGHHYTSTHPESVFQNQLVVARYLADDRHVTLTQHAITIRKPEQGTAHRELTEQELDDWLARLDVRLTADELDRLHRRIAALPS
ncbi:N-hydroxyarylamine O-acetyltransferase [Tamaricihabitans halophyticus]|uniref:N-hydroxyarylamine O-acetyltransferase n=1 Tax=Tamaricihabitans halophyticus TaxID=1262583 RepID=A0A4V2SSM6_9PSEU|nr:arylamine N-acetyltransferase [Tamaricihabitans halophyticus]TCP47346.1 N-hydroxyarylamine O-acetyltransferase [Tamaricihabitans halophyticus]